MGEAMGEVIGVGGFVDLGLTGPVGGDEGKERSPTGLVTQVWA